jgi:hypothetical protein
VPTIGFSAQASKCTHPRRPVNILIISTSHRALQLTREGLVIFNIRRKCPRPENREALFVPLSPSREGLFRYLFRPPAWEGVASRLLLWRQRCPASCDSRTANYFRRILHAQKTARPRWTNPTGLLKNRNQSTVCSDPGRLPQVFKPSVLYGIFLFSFIICSQVKTSRR